MADVEMTTAGTRMQHHAMAAAEILAEETFTKRQGAAALVHATLANAWATVLASAVR